MWGQFHFDFNFPEFPKYLKKQILSDNELVEPQLQISSVIRDYAKTRTRRQNDKLLTTGQAECSHSLATAVKWQHCKNK